MQRFVSIWFRSLVTDWFTVRKPELAAIPFVLSGPSHGRMVVNAANALAETQGVFKGMILADARAIIPGLHVVDDQPGLAEKLLKKIAEWCIRFTPCAAVDGTDGIILNASGCSHLWGGDEQYLKDIVTKLKHRGYRVKIAIADTIGAAWAVARFGKQSVIGKGENMQTLAGLPPAALRIDQETLERLNKLGIHQIKNILNMPRSALQRRFGNNILTRLNQAFGNEEEIIQPIIPVEVYQERLPCLEPITTATGIEIALKRLLNDLCVRFKSEGKGLRKASFKCYRLDGRLEEVSISTTKPSGNATHLFKLFEDKLKTIEPNLGIELFVLDAPVVEDHAVLQEKLWQPKGGLNDAGLSELIDRFAAKFGSDSIRRYLPAEHYWPERSVKPAASLNEKPATEWNVIRPRPIQLLHTPHHIDVTAPVPDYPPMNFRYKGKLHKILKADGPERIEQEWWIEDGQHRDYYVVEDENGCRYWLFRSGHYDENYEWFIHGFFA